MKHDDVFLRHILDETTFLLKEISPLSSRQLANNEVSKRACARSLEIIGEAVKNLSEEFKDSHPEIGWKRMAGMRDKIIHVYFGVNWDIVGDVIETHIPKLHDAVKRLIRKQASGK
jgi:uncharacterized protein with HEPN domain